MSTTDTPESDSRPPRSHSEHSTRGDAMSARKPLSLARAKVVLKRHVSTLSSVVRGSHSLEEALFVIARSFGSRAQGGKASRAKGQRGERELVAAFRALYPEAKRGLQSRGGTEVSDVGGLPIWLESKRHAKVSGALSIHYRTMSESDGRPAVTVVREDGKPPVALLSLDLLIGLLDEADVDPTELEARGRGIREAAQ